MRRTILYHKDHGVREFTEEEIAEYHQALEDGWVDAPWEVENPDYKVTDLSFPKPKPPEPEDKKTVSSKEDESTLKVEEFEEEAPRKPGRPKKGK